MDGDLLPAAVGHALRGSAPPRVRADAIRAFVPDVDALLAATRATGREHGFLAYLPSAPGAPLVAEPTSRGGPRDIRWRWDRQDAAVAFSLHTHPGAQALCRPSGIDLVGATVRGDHVVYVLCDDGRLSGWRFRRDAAREIEAAIGSLSDAKALRRGFVGFLYDACDAMGDALVERVYETRWPSAPAPTPRMRRGRAVARR